MFIKCVKQYFAFPLLSLLSCGISGGVAPTSVGADIMVIIGEPK
jgi:hypothetical protein